MGKTTIITKKTKAGKSKQILYKDAKIMWDDYQNNYSTPIQVKVNGKEEILKALRFDLKQIKSMVDYVGVGAATDLILTFGVKADGGKKYVTIIAGIVVKGADGEERMVTSNMYDFCDPCPDKCARIEAPPAPKKKKVVKKTTTKKKK